MIHTNTVDTKKTLKAIISNVKFSEDESSQSRLTDLVANGEELGFYSSYTQISFPISESS